MSNRTNKIDDQTWSIEDEGVRFFLLTGTEKGLLIDSGMTTKNAREIAEFRTDLPLQLLNTHADMDHIAGNDAFDTALMNPAEYINYFQRGASHPTPTPVWDGDVIDLGNRPLQIITQPGHTPGSIALLDINRRALFSGDSIQNGEIFLFGPMRNLIGYRQSLDKVWAHRAEYDLIYPSHADLPLKPEIIPELMAGMDQILAGEAIYQSGERFGAPIKIYDMGTAMFLCD
ncbi:MAG: MBL fold metallo-hydrolase [Oscillospiraceae bacterium]|nr:MBL fold metallo-hydrolase [Oscillospiraceae bacterium]